MKTSKIKGIARKHGYTLERVGELGERRTRIKKGDQVIGVFANAREFWNKVLSEEVRRDG